MQAQTYIAMYMQVMQHSYNHAHLFIVKSELMIIDHLFSCDTQMQ